LAEGFTLHIAPTTTNYEKLFNLTKAHLGLISQILFKKLRKQSAGWRLYQKALDRIAVSNFI
jgi:hypothetical protein